ncbi:MAG TPA: FecR domain-containing protein [Burkholderiales bacterium]|nr:FecR domain-containing protein [Burkholderiales bacterium]
MVRLLLALALLCITAHTAAQTAGGAPAAGAATAERTAAGKVELTEGDVRFADAANRLRRPRVGDAIYEGEGIATGADGEVHLRMEDGGYIAVRPGTRMRIVNFRAQADAEDRSVISLLQGSFRSVTGWIAKDRRDRAVINTPTATIGIRGTEHEPLVIPEGSKLGDPGTYDRVHAGETEIRTKQGTVSVRPNQAGFAALRGAQRPQVLDRVPAFFRPTRNEARFTGLHERVSRQLDQQREERRQFIEQRRKTGAERPGGGKGAKGADKGERKQLEQRRDEKQRAGEEKKQRSADERQAERRQSRDEQKRKMDEQKRERQERERKADDRKGKRQEQRKAEDRKKDHQEQQHKGDKRGKGDK